VQNRDYPLSCDILPFSVVSWGKVAQCRFISGFPSFNVAPPDDGHGRALSERPSHRPFPQPSAVHPPRYQFRTLPPCRSLFRLPTGYGISSDGKAAQGGAEASRLANVWRQKRAIGAVSRKRGICSAPEKPDRSPRSLDSPPASTGVMRPDVLPVIVAPTGPSDTPDTASAAGTPRVVEAGGPPRAAPAAAAAISPAVGPTADAVAGSPDLRSDRSQSPRRPRWQALTASFSAKDTPGLTRSLPNGAPTAAAATECVQKTLCSRKRARTRLGRFANGTLKGRQKTPHLHSSIPIPCSI